MDCWGDVETPAGAPRALAVDPRAPSCRGRPSAPRTSSSPTRTASSPAASRRPCASRSASCRRARSCSAWPTWSCSTTRSPARARTTRPSAPPCTCKSILDARRRRRSTARGCSRPSTATGTTRSTSPAGRTRCSRRRRRTCSSCSAPPARTRGSPSASSNGFDDPRDFFEWFMTPGEGRALIEPARRRVIRSVGMKRRVAIVGAGQSGMQLALGLPRAGHEVTVVSNRTAEEISAGPVMSSQCMFETALQTERELGLDCWADECPPSRASASWSQPGRRQGHRMERAARRARAVGRPAAQDTRVDGRVRAARRRGWCCEDVGLDRAGGLRRNARPRDRGERQGRDLGRLFERDDENARPSTSRSARWR